LLEIDQDRFVELDRCMEQVSALAASHAQDPTKLLHILRVLEKRHRQICDELFLTALPDSRHGLFNLLLEVESNGGWPYIYRINLQQLCLKLEQSLERDLALEQTASETLDSQTSD
jgi:hypothetical protein